MSNADHEKMNRIAERLGFSEEQTQTMHNFLDEELKSMETEDKNRMIPCSCCGEYWAAKDVDVWGYCPASRGE